MKSFPRVLALLGVILGSVLLASAAMAAPIQLQSTDDAPLSDNTADNLAVFTRLYGYIRYFHPSDEAAATDWKAFTVAGAGAVEDARGRAELIRTLGNLFAPIAPSLQVYETGFPPPAARITPPRSGAVPIVWRHLGGDLSQEGIGEQTTQSMRVWDAEANPSEMLTVELGAGVSAQFPIAVWRNESGATLPVARSRAAAPRPHSAAPSGVDRNTRLAGVVMTWAALRHFYPYFEFVRSDWNDQLEPALRGAAEASDGEAFRAILQRLLVPLEDGHARVQYGDLSYSSLPFTVGWIEDQLVVTSIRPGVETLAPGDVVVAWNGETPQAALEQLEETISGSPQWRRRRSLLNMIWGQAGEPVVVTYERPGQPQSSVTMRHGDLPAPASDPSMQPVTEIRPNVLYIDLTRISGADLLPFQDRMAAASGLIFDLRGYPKGGLWYLQRFTDRVVKSAVFDVPVITAPDYKNVSYISLPWRLEPEQPRFTGRAVFITDETAISFSESILSVVEENRLADIVGQPTAGANGNVSSLSLPGGYQVFWTGLRVVKGDGQTHHLRGIQPTVPVRRSIAGVREGRDELLERALALIGG